MGMIEKYDRFLYDNSDVMEYVGLHYISEDGEEQIILEIISSPNTDRVAAIHITSGDIAQSSLFKKLPPPLNHPAVLEAVRLTRDKPEIRAQFAKALAIQFNASNHAQKREIAELLRLYLPKKLRDDLICGEPCGQCPECAKRMEGR